MKKKLTSYRLGTIGNFLRTPEVCEQYFSIQRGIDIALGICYVTNYHPFVMGAIKALNRPKCVHHTLFHLTFGKLCLDLVSTCEMQISNILRVTTINDKDDRIKSFRKLGRNDISARDILGAESSE